MTDPIINTWLKPTSPAPQSLQAKINHMNLIVALTTPEKKEN